MTDSPHRLVFESFGVIAEVVSEEPEILSRVPPVLPPYWTEGRGEPEARFTLTQRGTVTRHMPDGQTEVYGPYGEVDALVRLGSLVRQHVANHAPRQIFIHAGVVRLDGVTVVMPGRSGAGKTTLVGALMRLGGIYYSDEYAVVDPDGTIHPFAKPLSVRRGGRQELGRPRPVPEELIATQPTRASLIVATNYMAGERWSTVPTSSAEAVLILLTNTPAARARPGDSLAVAGALARDATAFAGCRGEADEAAEELRAIVRA